MKIANKHFKSIGKRLRYVTIRSWTYPFFKKLYFLSLKGMGVLNYENNRLSGEKYFLNNILVKILDEKDEPVLFDVGANVGNYSKLLKKIFPNSKVYAFEPHPGNYQKINKLNIDNLHTFNLALGNDEKVVELYDFASSEGTELASIFHDVISDIHKRDVSSFSVNMRKIDDVCDAEGIKNIDFLKIDTEGNELFVLEGAKRLLENKAIKCIHFEFNEMNVISKVFMRDFVNLLDNYELYRLLPKGMISLEDSPVLTEIYAYQNIIAINKQ